MSLSKAVEENERKKSKKKPTHNHDISERRMMAEPEEKEKETKKSLYVITEGGIEKARTPGAKDIKPRKKRPTTSKGWGELPKAKGMTSQEKKFWNRYREEKKYLKDPEKDLAEIDRARHAYDKYFKK